MIFDSVLHQSCSLCGMSIVSLSHLPPILCPQLLSPPHVLVLPGVCHHALRPHAPYHATTAAAYLPLLLRAAYPYEFDINHGCCPVLGDVSLRATAHCALRVGSARTSPCEKLYTAELPIFKLQASSSTRRSHPLSIVHYAANRCWLLESVPPPPPPPSNPLSFLSNARASSKKITICMSFYGTERRTEPLPSSLILPFKRVHGACTPRRALSLNFALTRPSHIRVSTPRL